MLYFIFHMSSIHILLLAAYNNKPVTQIVKELLGWSQPAHSNVTNELTDWQINHNQTTKWDNLLHRLSSLFIPCTSQCCRSKINDRLHAWTYLKRIQLQMIYVSGKNQDIIVILLRICFLVAKKSIILLLESFVITAQCINQMNDLSIIYQNLNSLLYCQTFLKHHSFSPKNLSLIVDIRQGKCFNLTDAVPIYIQYPCIKQNHTEQRNCSRCEQGFMQTTWFTHQGFSHCT